MLTRRILALCIIVLFPLLPFSSLQADDELLAQLTPRITELRNGQFTNVRRNVTQALKRIPKKPETAIIRRQLRAVRLLATGASLLAAQKLDESRHLKKIENFYSDFRKLGNELQFHDTPVLVAVVQAAPVSVKTYARLWLNRARRKVVQIESISQYLQAMALPDQELRQLATAKMASLIAKLRGLVDNGGALNFSQQQFLQSRVLIDTLISQLARESNDPAIDKLAALKLAKHSMNARAIHALTLIEEPAITALEAAVKAKVRRASQALTKLKTARLARLQKYPESLWYSAVALQEQSPTDKK